ncbi:MAG: LacI family DNA-binding transcriptional regulator [Anaerolineae bacterium]
MALTLEQVATLAGVSRSTVSRVVNDHPNVNAETREAVWGVIHEHGFHPNNAARTLASRRSQMIGLVIPQALSTVFSDPYFPILIQGIAAACEEQEYYLMLSLVRAQSPTTFRRLVGGGHLDGLIVASALAIDPFVDRLLIENFPFVLIGRSLSEAPITTIDADNVHGATMATQHLLRLGYKRIATISGPQDMVAGMDRLEGFRVALRAAGTTPPPEYVQEGDWSEWSGQRGMSTLLSLASLPQAVFIASDAMAIGALKVIRSAGMQVPGDIALVSFDDIPLASSLETPLTTVRQPIHQLGYTAASVLIDRLRNSDRGGEATATRIVLPTELVVRASCGQQSRFAAAQRQPDARDSNTRHIKGGTPQPEPVHG